LLLTVASTSTIFKKTHEYFKIYQEKSYLKSKVLV
jgi:hypothetical protein